MWSMMNFVLARKYGRMPLTMDWLRVEMDKVFWVWRGTLGGFWFQ
jgi:hypothetical protein